MILLRWKLAALYSALTILAYIPLHAQPTAPDTTRIYRLPTIVVEAMRTPLVIDSVPYAVSIREADEGRPGLALDEVLSRIPGVQADNRFNYAVGERISIRGFGARTQFGVRGVRVVADGVPTTFADGQSALEIIEPSEVERAEVIRGPAAALYGNAAGGVIALRSAELPAVPIRLSASENFGSDHLMHGLLRAAGTSGDVSYGLDLSALRYDGYRDHSADSTYRAGAKLRYRIGGDDALRFDGAFVKFSADNPGSLSDSLLALDRRAAFSTNVKQKTGKRGTQEQAGLGWDHDFGWSTLDFGTYAIHRDITNPIIGRIIELGRNAGGVRAVLHGEDTLFAHRPINWTAGADLDLQLDDRQNFINSNGERGKLALDQDERVIGVASFAQAIVPVVNSVQVMGGLRYDRIGFDVQDHFVDSTDPDDSGDRTMEALSPSLGINWSAARELNIYANVATAFETPTTTELANRPSGAGGFNPDLQPQRALSFEAGARGSIVKAFRYTLSSYTARITNELIPFQEPDGSGRDYFRNAGSALHRGVEAAVDVIPFDGALLNASYTFTDARFTSYTVKGKVYDRNRIPGIAPHRIEGQVSYTLPFGLYAALEGRYNSSVFANDANSASSPAYTLFNLRAGLVDTPLGVLHRESWRTDIGLTAGVNNLFDVRYNSSVTINATGGRFYEPGAGRTWYVQLVVGLGKEK
jgi:iron complex outermembrane receptor protein